MNTLVVEEVEMGEGDQTELVDTVADVYKILSEDRVLFISDFIDDKVASDVVATLLVKESENNKAQISIVLNSPGGDIRSVFMIYDMMKIMKSPINTICMGSVMSEAVLILAAGTPGLRFVTPNAMISPCQITYDMAHYSDLVNAKITMDQIQSDNKLFIGALAKCVKKPVSEVMADFERRVFFNAVQAKSYGIVDKLTKTRNKSSEKKTVKKKTAKRVAKKVSK